MVMGGNMTNFLENLHRYGGWIVAAVMAIVLFYDPPAGLKDHALLSAPFLYFLSFVILVSLFHKPIGALLSRGNVTIKWGDKEISMQELEENIDKEVDTVAGDVEFLKSENETKTTDIDFLKAEVSKLVSALQKDGTLKEADTSNDTDAQSHSSGTGEKSEPFSSTPINQIRENFDLSTDAESSIIYHLGNSKYKWRNEKTLQNRTLLDQKQIRDFSRNHPELVVQSRAKSGNTIYRLTEDARAQFRDSTGSG